AHHFAVDASDDGRGFVGAFKGGEFGFGGAKIAFGFVAFDVLETGHTILQGGQLTGVHATFKGDDDGPLGDLSALFHLDGADAAAGARPEDVGLAVVDAG